MAINKDFVVKNGLEVNRLLIRTNTTNNRVGINTDVINSTLDVNGQISAKSLSITGVTTFSTINVSSSLQLNGSSGSNGQYLKSTGTGVTWSNFPSTRTTSTIAAVLGQTLFTFNYNIGFLDVFINGTKLSSTDFLAVDGNNIILSTPCFGGETVEFISYSAETIGITTTLIIGIGGITIQEEGSVVGLGSGVSTLNFVGSSVTAIASGIGATIYISPNSSQWITTAAGIHTLSNVGIGTTNPRFALEVGAVGASGTTLFVNGNARVTGIVTIGPASITLNGITNIINVGTGITINGSTGIISATAIVLGGTTLTGAAVTSITAGSGISVNQSTGNVTITATGGGGSSQFVTTAAGIHTLSNIGIGTTNPTSALTVSGDVKVTGVVTATTFIGALTGTATTATNAQGLTGTPNITVGVATASTLNVGTSGTVITTTTTGLVGIGTTNPTSALTVGAVGSATTNLVVNGFAKIDQIVVKNNSNSYQDNIIMTQHPAGTFTGGRNVAIGDYSFTTPGAAGENVAIGYYALSKVGNNNTVSTYNGNTAVGSWSGENATTTLRNTFIGWEAGKYITSGSENVILGSYNGNFGGLDIRTSSNNVVLSDGAGNIRFYANSSGNVGIGTTNPTEKLTVVGVTSSTSFYGDSSYTASGRWTLGANGFSDYTFVGIGFTQTTNDPVLYLARGRVYEFVNNSGGSHPFQIRVSNGGSAYSDGVTNNGGASGVIRFEVPFNAPNTLYYQCTVHSGMGNTISVYPNTI